jgi:predicted hydrocarbon binding protein
MNGIIFIEIGRFARAQLGDDIWRETVRLAGVPDRFYYRVADYPDEEALTLLSALSARMQEPLEVILKSLGEYIVPDLMRMARYWIEPDWKTLDLIANTEHTIHEMLRAEGSQTNPPRLQCQRTGDDEVVVNYDSPRKMCALAKGIITGVSKHYGESVTIDEPSCMLKGDAVCRLVVKVVRPAS